MARPPAFGKMTDMECKASPPLDDACDACESAASITASGGATDRDAWGGAEAASGCCSEGGTEPWEEHAAPPDEGMEDASAAEALWALSCARPKRYVTAIERFVPTLPSPGLLSGSTANRPRTSYDLLAAAAAAFGSELALSPLPPPLLRGPAPSGSSDAAPAAMDVPDSSAGAPPADPPPPAVIPDQALLRAVDVSSDAARCQEVGTCLCPRCHEDDGNPLILACRGQLLCPIKVSDVATVASWVPSWHACM